MFDVDFLDENVSVSNQFKKAQIEIKLEWVKVAQKSPKSIKLRINLKLKFFFLFKLFIKRYKTFYEALKAFTIHRPDFFERMQSLLEWNFTIVLWNCWSIKETNIFWFSRGCDRFNSIILSRVCIIQVKRAIKLMFYFWFPAGGIIACKIFYQKNAEKYFYVWIQTLFTHLLDIFQMMATLYNIILLNLVKWTLKRQENWTT